MLAGAEDWLVVYSDGTVSPRPLTRREARHRSALSCGSQVVSQADFAQATGRYSRASLFPGPNQQNHRPGV